MHQFNLKENSYLDKKACGYFSYDYVGYQQPDNPDFINRLKNMTKKWNELELVHDFIMAYETAYKAIGEIIRKETFSNCVVAVIPRSKTENSYSQSQRLFRKAISCATDKLGLSNATDAIKRIRNTKTTHSWRLENNAGNAPYPGITKDTCEISARAITGKNVILVDDVYTEGVNIAEDCIQTLYDLGAKCVILYVIAKTKTGG